MKKTPIYTVLLVLMILPLVQCSGDGAVIPPIVPVLTDPATIPNPATSPDPTDVDDTEGTITGNPVGEPAIDENIQPPIDPVISPDVPEDSPETNEIIVDDGGDDLTDDADNGDVTDSSDSDNTDTDSGDVDAPGWIDPGPFAGDDDTDIIPPAPDTGDEEPEMDLYAIDDDGDGLANAIDPRVTVKDFWGFIDSSDESYPCVAERSGYIYDYIAGEKNTIRVTQFDDEKILSDKVVAKPSRFGRASVELVNAFGIVTSNNIYVDGLLKRSEARLPTVNCLFHGEAGVTYDFDYGLYVRRRDLSNIQILKR